jgi:hypothetical protein
MGIRLASISPNLLKLMSDADRIRYGGQTNTVIAALEPRVDLPPEDAARGRASSKTDKLEREEQRQFASWLMLHDLPLVWHRTDKRTGCNVGCPDFILGSRGKTYWIEFKRPGFKLGPDQEKFRQRLEAQGIRLYVCYNAAEAIQLVQEAAAV